MNVKISPSIMCCNTFEYEEYIEKFEKVGVDYIHFDVMDGHFVPNIMLGTNIYKHIKSNTNIPLDIHLMVKNPEKFINLFEVNENDIMTVHFESTRNIYSVLTKIKEKGCKVGIAVNPGTPAYAIEEVLNIVDIILVMTINPGFAGQKIIPSMIDKVAKIRKIINKNNFNTEIMVDGNTTLENAQRLLNAGANIFVVGTSSILKPNINFFKVYNSYLSTLRRASDNEAV